MGFPAFCPHCGLVFDSAIHVENSRNITFENVRQNCPRCGGDAEIPDGTFNVLDDTIEVLAGSGLTRARLQALAAVLAEARSGERSDESAFEELRNASPALSALIDHFSPTMKKALIVFLWFVIQMLLSQGISELRDDSATRTDVQEAVEHAVQEMQNHPR